MSCIFLISYLLNFIPFRNFITNKFFPSEIQYSKNWFKDIHVHTDSMPHIVLKNELRAIDM